MLCANWCSCYQQHPALAGLAVEISAESFLELPGELWGLDDDTVARFERDNATKVPGQGDKRFAERARFFAKPGAMANRTCSAICG